jgi:hypothetical protein
MKQLLFLLLFPCLALAQYQGNAGQKITLGEQTTADGLIYRGLAADTTRKPSVDTMAYILLDTNTNIIWQYKKATNNAWTRVGGSISSGVTGVLPVANGGTNTSTAFTTGSVVFAGASGTYTQANEDIRFITGDKRLVLGPNTILSPETQPFDGVRFKSMGKIQIARSDEDTRFITIDNEGGLAKMDFKAPAAGYGAFQFTQTNNAETRNLMLFNGDGNVGIKTPTFAEITQALHVVGNARITAVGTVSDGNAALYVTSTGVLSTNASDVNKKHNIRNLPYGLSTINNLNPVAFEWNETDETDIGFIAQDIENVIPESVITNWDSELIFRQEKIIPVLVKAIQEQQALIKALEQRILTLENK